MPDFKLEDFLYKSNIIQPLKGFCNTIQEGSINKAATKMGLTQSTVTRQIKALERDLGIKLFDRVGNRVVPTEEANQLYELAIVQLQGLESLLRNFHDKLGQKNRKTLTIAAHYTSLINIMPKYIKKLISRIEFKDVEIKLCNIPRQEALNRLVNDKIDLAFYPSVEHDNIPIEIEKTNIFRFKNVLFMDKSHPLAKKNKIQKEDMEKHQYLLIDKYTFYDLSKIIEFPPINIKLENGNSAITMALAKEGIAMGGGSEVYLNEGKNKDENIIFKDVDHIFPKMFYSLFLLKNKQIKESVSFIKQELIEDSDLINKEKNV